MSEFKSESVRLRYFSKVFSSGLGAFLGLAQQSLLTRALGASVYGQYMFIQSHFQNIFSIVECGVATGFFTFFSKSPTMYRAFMPLNILLIFAIFVGVFVYFLSVTLFGWAPDIWPDIQVRDMFLGLLLGTALYLSRRAQEVTDAAGVAVKIETDRQLRALLSLSLFLLLWFLNQIHLVSVLIVLGLSHLLFSFQTFLMGHRAMGSPKLSVDRAELKKAWKELMAYSSPLVFYSFFSIFATLLERWTLQIVGGSAQQGFFGIAQQISMICFLLGSAMTPVFHRESSKAFAESDFKHLRHLFEFHVRRTMAVTAIPSIFIAIYASGVVAVIGGQQFVNAAPVVSLMALYPIQQTYGQLSGTFLLTTHRTKLYSILGLALTFFGIVLAYLFMAPRSWTVPGAELGALGLALKFIVFQFVGVSVFMFLNCRYLQLSFWRFQLKDLELLSILALLAWISRQVSSTMGIESFGPLFSNLFAMGVGFALYLSCVLVYLRLSPRSFGFENFRIVANLAKKVVQKLTTKK